MTWSSAMLEEVPTEELVNELTRRGDLPHCPCRRWKTYVGRYDADGNTLRCAGCRRSITKCTCGQ